MRGAKLAAARRQEADANARCEEADAAAATLQRGVAELFAAARCDPVATRALLGEGDVTEENVMQYLGILEQRAAELIHSVQQVLDSCSVLQASVLPTESSQACTALHYATRSDKR